ncbi:MAG TPA: hypothetical protein VFJ02_01510 [Vicinamibacterales bacterium]|nr:hypothetical protein [Vicinamibacterales bacterium]
MSDDDALRAWHFKQLRWSLHALATAGSTQRALFPERVHRPDELAFEFDHWLSLIRRFYGDDLPPGPRDALAAVERKLSTMSRDGVEFDLDLWTDAAVAGSEQWADVRRLAAAALAAFEWPAAPAASVEPQWP